MLYSTRTPSGLRASFRSPPDSGRTSAFSTVSALQTAIGSPISSIWPSVRVSTATRSPIIGAPRRTA